MGAWAAEIFSEMGGKVLAVSDAFGAVENAEGLNIPELRRHLAAGGKLADFPGGALGCIWGILSRCAFWTAPLPDGSAQHHYLTKELSCLAAFLA